MIVDGSQAKEVRGFDDATGGDGQALRQTNYIRCFNVLSLLVLVPGVRDWALKLVTTRVFELNDVIKNHQRVKAIYARLLNAKGKDETGDGWLAPLML